MKKPIAWVVDSTAHIDTFMKNNEDLHVVPLNIHFGENQYADGIDLTTEELYERIRNSEEFPKTSQPSAGEFANIFKKLSEQYDAIIAVHLSSKLSGTFASSKAGAELAEVTVDFVDSLSISEGISELVKQGMELQRLNMNPHDIAKKLQEYSANCRNYIMIGNLNQLYKGGRMSGLQFYLGSLLQVKPIVQISATGELVAIDKVRLTKKAFNYLVDRTVEAYDQDGVRKITLIHGNNLPHAEEVKSLILAKKPDLQVEIGEISSVIAVHAGEGTVAAIWHTPFN